MLFTGSFCRITLHFRRCRCWWRSSSFLFRPSVSRARSDTGVLALFHNSIALVFFSVSGCALWILDRCRRGVLHVQFISAAYGSFGRIYVLLLTLSRRSVLLSPVLSSMACAAFCCYGFDGIICYCLFCRAPIGVLLDCSSPRSFMWDSSMTCLAFSLIPIVACRSFVTCFCTWSLYLLGLQRNFCFVFSSLVHTFGDNRMVIVLYVLSSLFFAGFGFGFVFSLAVSRQVHDTSYSNGSQHALLQSFCISYAAGFSLVAIFVVLGSWGVIILVSLVFCHVFFRLTTPWCRRRCLHI